MCLLAGDILFLGSSQGDSILSQFFAKDQSNKSLEPSTKRARLTSNATASNSSSAFFNLLDQIEDQENDTSSQPKDEDDDVRDIFKSAQGADEIRAYSFKVLDTLLNIGPISDMDVGNVYNETDIDVS